MTSAHTIDGAKWTYGYDAFARQLFKQEWVRNAEKSDGVDKIFGATASRHEFLWHGDIIASETITDGENKQKIDWHFEPESFVPVARKEMDYLSYVVTDHLGTPKEIVGETGHLEWAAEYRTWGELKRFEGHAPKPRSKPHTERDQWGFIPLDAEGSALIALRVTIDSKGTIHGSPWFP